jgi:acylphosphatase
MQQVHVIISGMVQGVGFRYFIKSWAKSMSITGWTQNTTAGQVEAVFQGKKAAIEKMISVCRRGPFLAEVKDVQVSTEAAKEWFNDFAIV